ncbi:O-antigen ligase family protein [Marinimicrobium sp. C6131]|uniref:O-antigen ligase family protein n=1 Tax=Marinimicrobium sp. C6131 TaxID=3022676 RepID=UPI00223DB1C0|nr:O-antigen ligase family protein [Marinimicrobium sp. C6131]UZJ43919.1 O-antigen ligase family protein [Marinimicrobium sp. C6131]
MQLIQDTKNVLRSMKGQDFGFYAAALYLLLEYVRPHVIYPFIDILPWTQLTILLGLFYVIVKGQLKFQMMHFVLLCFVGAAYISSFLSYDPTASFNRIDYIVSWFVVVIFFTGAVRNLEQYKLLTILLFLFLFKMSLFGAKTWVMRGFSFTSWGISGPRGFFQNSGELSLLMVIFAAMSFSYIAANKSISKYYYIVPITAVMTVLAASSRGSQLAMAVVAVLLAIMIGKLRFRNMVLFGIVCWAGFTLLPEEQKERFSTMGDDATSESRLIYWEKGLEMMHDHKLFGVGYYAFPSYFEDKYVHSVNFENFRYRREVAHNSYIQVGSEMGYIGLSIYLLLIFIFFRLTSKTRKLIDNGSTISRHKWVHGYCTGLNIAFIGYIIGSTFMSVAFYPYLYLFLMLAQSLYNSVNHEKEVHKHQFTNSSVTG